MSRNVNQIFIANPASSMLATDLYYLGRSPYGLTNDMAITWGNVLGSIQAQASGTWSISITGNAATVTTNANLTGDVTSVGNTTTLSTVNSNTGTFGDGTHVGTFTVNGKGLITAASSTLITGAAPTGSAGGDLGGTYPNPSVLRINGVSLGTTTATSGNALLGNGTQWVSVPISGDATLVSSGALTLSTVNTNIGTFGDATHVSTITVNAKGLITAASSTAITGFSPSALTSSHLFIGNASNVATDTALSGDATLANTGALTLATVNSNVGTFQGITINGKGLVTAAVNAGYITGNQTVTLSGDITGSGATAITTTLATVNSNVGTFGSATQVPQITVNGKGLVTAVSNVAITATGTVTSVATGTGLTGGPITSTGTISVPANGITNALLAQAPTLTIKGNNTGGTANELDLTVAQVNTMLGTITASQPTINQPNIVGVTNGSNAAAGSVGEVISSTVLAASGVSLPGGGAGTNVTSISLTPGVWDISGVIGYIGSSGAAMSYTISAITSVSGNPGDQSQWTMTGANVAVATTNLGSSIYTRTVNITTTTIYYLIAAALITAGTVSGSGYIQAKRVR